MRLVAPPAPDLRPVDACTASLRGWLIALLAWFCDVVDALPASAWRCAIVRDAYAAAKRRIAQDLRCSVGHLRRIVFLRAYASFRTTTGRIQPHKFARGVRPGLRAGEKRRRYCFRAITAGVIAGMHEGSLRERVKRFRAMLDDPARLIARVLKRLHAIWRTPHGSGLVLVSAHDACESRAPQSAPAFANSS